MWVISFNCTIGYLFFHTITFIFFVTVAETVLKKEQLSIYFFKANNRNTRKRCEICSKLTIKTPDDVVLVFLSLTWTYFTSFSSVPIVDFKPVNISYIVGPPLLKGVEKLSHLGGGGYQKKGADVTFWFFSLWNNHTRFSSKSL